MPSRFHDGTHCFRLRHGSRPDEGHGHAHEAFRKNARHVEFKLVKGKVGKHVHAYVDGELMEMFESEKGILTGIRPGNHTLELRVATEDHMAELKATDKVQFVVK